jgi:ribose transport system ATP-binding protein
MQGAGMLSEDRKNEGLAVGLSVADNITASKLTDFGPLGLVMPGPQAIAAQCWIDALDIRCIGPLQKVEDLSGGNQQKVALARLLHHDVDVLFLDEPTRGIDVASKAQVYELIDGLACGRDTDGEPSVEPKAVLMVSSYLPELMGICDRVAVMHRGRLGMPRPVAELDEHAIMMEATGQEIGS